MGNTAVQLELRGLSATDDLRTCFNWLLEALDCEFWTRKMHADHCRYLLAHLGDVPVSSLRYSTVMGYVEHEKRRGLSKESIRKRLSTLKMALREGVNHGVLDRVPDLPVVRARCRPKQGYWTKLQWEAVHLACDGDDEFRTWIACNWWLGSHSSDLDRFRWQDIDLVRKTWVRRNTKVHAQPIVLPLPDRLWKILLARHGQIQPHPRDPVCGHPMGHPNRELRALADRAGVPAISPIEAGRHSCETYMEECGCSKLHQITWLGLTSERMLRHYRHPTPSTIAAGVAAMNQ